MGALPVVQTLSLTMSPRVFGEPSDDEGYWVQKAERREGVKGYTNVPGQLI